MKFRALIKSVQRKSLASGDLSVRILLEGMSPEESVRMLEAVGCPSDREVTVEIIE